MFVDDLEMLLGLVETLKIRLNQLVHNVKKSSPEPQAAQNELISIILLTRNQSLLSNFFIPNPFPQLNRCEGIVIISQAAAGAHNCVKIFHNTSDGSKYMFDDGVFSILRYIIISKYILHASIESMSHRLALQPQSQSSQNLLAEIHILTLTQLRRAGQRVA